MASDWAVALVERLHDLGGAHGVGRVDHVEDRLVGIKSREIYETPAATILHEAHRALEGLTLSRDTLRFNRFVADELARLIYDGLWFSALSRDLRAYVASSQRVVSGEVRVRLDHGSAVLVGRRSPMSLYDKSLATYDEGDAFDHASAVGFIEIFGLPLRVEAARHGAVGKHHGAAWTWTDPLLVGAADACHGSGAGGGLRRSKSRRRRSSEPLGVGRWAACRLPPCRLGVGARAGTCEMVLTKRNHLAQCDWRSDHSACSELSQHRRAARGDRRATDGRPARSDQALIG